MALTGLDGEKLPELVPMGSVVGTVLPEIAAELGLSPHTRVIAGANDMQTLAIGTGAERGGVGLSIGTTAGISVISDRIDPETEKLYPFEFESGVLTMVAPIQSDNGFHLVNAEAGYGGKALEHVLKNLVFNSDHFGDHSTEDLYFQLDQAMGNVEPGANGVIFFPWLDGSWMPGLDGNARGGFINMSLRTTREEMVRAVMEGVAYQLRWIYPAVQAFAGRDVNSICFGGGGARSDVWAQIIADIVGVPVHQLERPELTNCRGAAMLAFHNLDLIDLHTIADWKRVKRIYHPRPQYQKRYQIMGDAFIKAHEQLQPVHQMLAMMQDFH
jgi:xylulokinase